MCEGAKFSNLGGDPVFLNGVRQTWRMTAEVPDPVLAELAALRQQVAELSAAVRKQADLLDRIWRYMA